MFGEQKFKVHKLKIDYEYFSKIYVGLKTFEIRYDDRGYKVGDILVLKAWDKNNLSYVHTSPIIVRITYILSNEKYLQPGYICMSIKVMETEG